MRDHPEYPDPQRFLNAAQHYFFRHEDLLHLRFEQYSRYFAARRELSGEARADAQEDTIQDDDGQENSTYHALLLPKQSYFSVLDPRLVIPIKMDAERRFEAVSPKLSNLPIKETTFMKGRLNVNERQILLSLRSALTRLHAILLI